jgi:hypothetical protein
MTKPNIQIDDEVREMTDEEYAELLAQAGQRKPMKRLALLSLLTITLTACADRVRENCETTKANGLLERRCS